MKRVILVDNYDSFTWNIYQYLCQAGAHVEVYRNDEITVAEIEAKDYDTIVLSPGPGHPKSDSGICQEIITHFIGKKPVFGICLGEQTMIHVFGGTVSYAGEIVHGKTSIIQHDGKGVFKNVSQGISATRYHSLAGEISTLPDCLEVTARTASGIVMGIRHKKYVMEGVQFHPESILTEEGHTMIENMLSIDDTTWEAVERKAAGAKEAKPAGGSQNILEKIYAQRKKDYAAIEQTPGQKFTDLEAAYAYGIAPAVKDLTSEMENATKSGNSVVFAEIKRSSPSKGPIAMNINALEQADKYASAGAFAISVLTEPHWFNGSLGDLRDIRKMLDVKYGSKRPLLLRKEFIFSKYQILEARLAGADTVLLIVKMLSPQLLQELYEYSVSLGMEPLVEVNTAAEMEQAAAIRAKVVGVNNRDLTTFKVDLNNSSTLVQLLPKGAFLLALSGIFDAQTAHKYRTEGIAGFLVGEALMKAANVGSLISELVHS